MADSAERQLRILLRLAADTAGAQQIKAELKSVEAQAASTNAAVNASAGGGVAGTQQRVQFAGVLAAEEAKAAAALTQQSAVESQLQVIAATRLELAGAIANGERGQAELLRGELGIRQATLGAMRAETLTQAELNKLSANEEVLLGKLAQNAAATAAGGVLAGASLNKAKAEALQLSKEFATGSLNARTLGAFLGSLGPTLTIGAIAGFGIVEIFSHLNDEAIAFNKELDKITAKFAEQGTKLRDLARDAKDSRDIHSLTTAILPELTQLGEKLREIREREFTGWQRFINLFDRDWSGLKTGGYYEQQRAKDAERVKIIDDAAVLRAHALIGLGKEAAAEWERVKLLPVAEAISIYANKLDDLRAKQNAVDTTTKNGIAQYDTLGREIGETEEKLRTLQDRTRETVQFEVGRLSELRQQQELINANPLLGIDEKNEQLHNLYLKERTTLLSEIIKLTALIAELEKSGMTGDDPHVQRLRKELQDVNFEVDKLSFKLKETGSFSDQLGISLTEWVNGFGTAAQQVAGLIEGSINATLQGTNQLLLDAAFRTGDWQQTLVGVERQIGNLFLTFLEKQIESFILGETHKATSTATSLSQAGALAAGYAPAAAGSAIATSGTSAIVGEIAAIAAIAAIIAALSGAFKKGGLTGTDQIARVGEEGPEFVFTHRATKNIGADNLYAMMHAAERAPRFGSGGRVNYPGLFPGNDIEPRWLPGADLPNDFFNQGPTVDLGFGERPIFHWPYGGPNQGGYIVESGTTIYPGDHGEPPFTVVDANGLPIGPGMDPNEPVIGLGPRPPGGPNVFVPRHPGFTPGGGLTIIPGGIPGIGPSPWWTNFNPSLGSNFSANVDWSRTPNYNSSRGTWEWFDANHQLVSVPGPAPLGFSGAPNVTGSNSFIPDPNRTFFDPATGRVLTPVSYDSSTGTTFYRDDSGHTYAAGPSVQRGPTGGVSLYTNSYDQFVKNYLAGGGDPGGPNDMGTTTDTGHTIFYPNAGTPMGYADPEGMGIVQRSSRTFGRGQRDPRWVFPSQAESARLGLSFSSNADKYNAWLIAHNPWFYDALGHHADGSRIPGPASRADNILAWLSTGERVVSADRNLKLEQAFGFDWDRRIESSLPRFATGGRVAAGVSPARGQRSVSGRPQKIIVVADARAAAREAQREPEYESHIIDILSRNRHELALPPAQ